MVKRTLTCWLAAASLISAQDAALFRKAPAAVEDALRARVEKFYELHVAGKFREAEGLVCEDSKDAFYNSKKRQPDSFEIGSITYENNYTSANVIVNIRVTNPWFGKQQKMLLPVPSSWELQNGVWCYSIPKVEGDTMLTPFGPMLSPKPAGAGSGQAAAKKEEEAGPVTVEQVFSGPQLSPMNLTFVRGKAGEQVATFTNGLPGYVKLLITSPGLEGVEVKPSSQDVPPRGSAEIRIRYQPTEAELPDSATVAVRVEPLNQVFRLNLRFEKAQ